MTISYTATGDFHNTEAFLKKMLKFNLAAKLRSAAAEGVAALAAATPKESGLTANSWTAEVTIGANGFTIEWQNTHVVSGVPIAIILQYGHGTGTGGYVQGRDYINPAIQPVFDKIADEIWKEVTS